MADVQYKLKLTLADGSEVDAGTFTVPAGENGHTPYIQDGYWYINGVSTGVKAAGSNGTSVTIKSVSESAEDGGSNVVTFSDGTIITIKNGSGGKNGTSVSVSSVSESTISGGNNVVAFSDGKFLSVKNGKDGSDGYTPVKGVDYDTPEDRAEIDEHIVSEVAKRGQLAPEYANSTDECVDTSKMYVLPDGFIYAYFEKEGTLAYTNLRPLADTATLASGDASATVNEGWFSAVRLNSSGLLKAQTGYAVTGFIPYTYQSTDDYIKIKDFSLAPNSTYQQELCFYDSSHAFLGYAGHTYSSFETMLNDTGNGAYGWYVEKDSDGAYTLTWKPAETTPVKNGTVDTSKIAYVRICAGDFTNAIITVNEEIVGGGSAGGLGFHNTGKAFVPADYENRINELESRVDSLNPTKSDDDMLEYIRNWDMPIYDADIPVFIISSEKSAIQNSELNPASLYARYDALMSVYPRYITKTDHGLCSDGVNHLYQYDFKAPTTDYTGSLFSEQKPKAILISGIHQEPSGAYGLYYALEELVSNLELRSLLNNVHLIVLPCANPYAFDTTDIDNVYLNANGVEIHRNFEVGFVEYGAQGDAQYSGAEPLSEIESQVIDRVMRANQDAAFVMSCHTFNSASGKNVMWGSCGTKYTCNLACRLIQKMSVSFIDRFGGEFTGIDNSDPDMGWVSISNTGGSEYRQATKYGIQGFNLEVSETFAPHDTTKRTAFAMTRYAEVYANMILTAFGVYDYKDKDNAGVKAVSVFSVSESNESGGTNIVKFSDGKTLSIKNGKSGASGKTAYQYAQDGGYTGTEKEFAERFAYLMGQSLVGNIDENNVITVMGELSAGTYIVKYENADGTKTDIGTITIGGSGGNESSYTNILNNTTIELNTRLSSTFNQTKTGDSKATGVFTTGWIDLDLSAQPDPCYLYLRGCYWDINTSQTQSTYLWYADVDEGGLEYQSYLANVETLDNGDTRIKIGYSNTNAKLDYYDSIKKIRISAAVSSSTITEADMANVIITINEPITD